MVMRSQRLSLVATDDGLHLVDGVNATAVDDLAGRGVLALAKDDAGAWALVDGRELWRSADMFGWARVATVPQRKAGLLAPAPAGRLVGTARAHLLRLEEAQLVVVPSFDRAEGRDGWYT